MSVSLSLSQSRIIERLFLRLISIELIKSSIDDKDLPDNYKIAKNRWFCSLSLDSESESTITDSHAEYYIKISNISYYDQPLTECSVADDHVYIELTISNHEIIIDRMNSGLVTAVYNEGF